MPKRSASQSARLSHYGAQYGSNRAYTLERYAAQESRARCAPDTIQALVNAWIVGLISLSQIGDDELREAVREALGF